MVEEKSLFERLDDISAGQSVVLNEITGVKTQVSDTNSKITELEQEIQKLKSRPIIQPKPSTNTQLKNDKEILQAFLKQSIVISSKFLRPYRSLTCFSLTPFFLQRSLITFILISSTRYSFWLGSMPS